MAAGGCCPVAMTVSATPASVADDDVDIEDVDDDIAVVVAAAATVSVWGWRVEKDDDTLSLTVLGRNITASSRRSRRLVSCSAAESYTRLDHEATISKAIVVVIIPTIRFDAGLAW
jgi:hypothetical protein